MVQRPHLMTLIGRTLMPRGVILLSRGQGRGLHGIAVGRGHLLAERRCPRAGSDSSGSWRPSR